MRLNDFSVRIPGSREDAVGYVEVDHGTQYSIRLANFRNTACDVKVVVDGKDCGTFRLSPFGRFLLERPGHDSGRFTAYTVGTADAAQAGIDARDPNTGLVQVTFTPAKKVVVRTWYSHTVSPGEGPVPKWVEPDIPTGSLTGDRGTVTTNYVSTEDEHIPAMASPGTPKAVGTGLSGESGQSFVGVVPLDYDYSQQTVVHLRLISPRDNGPRPLTSHSTPVPPPVG